MRPLALLLFVFLATPLANADPAWLSPNIQLSDCDDAFWKTKGMCYVEYDRQQMARINQFIRDEIRYMNADSCDSEQLLQHFEDREKAWAEYSRHYCAYANHCVGGCGSGHSSAYHDCNSKMSGERREFLLNELTNGVSLWGCKIMGSTSSKILLTENYEIYLSGNCERGLFVCDQVSYQGRNRNTNSQIKLSGGVLMERDEKEYIDMPVGYIFVNGDIEYRVSNAGLLKVTDTKQDKVLLEEQGTWK